MKYVSKKQKLQDGELLANVVHDLDGMGFNIQYEISNPRRMRNLNMYRTDSAEEKDYLQNLTDELLSILKEHVFNDSITDDGVAIVKEYADYPGAQKPYYITISENGTEIDLIHAHYYQSKVDRDQEQIENKHLFEERDTIYYDVQNDHIVCYPISIGNNHDENFWGACDVDYLDVITKQNIGETIELTRNNRLTQYFTLIHGIAQKSNIPKVEKTEQYYTTYTCLRLLHAGHISRDAAAAEIGITSKKLASYMQWHPTYSLDKITMDIVKDKKKEEDDYQRLDAKWSNELAALTEDEKADIFATTGFESKKLDAAYLGAYIMILLYLKKGCINIQDATQEMHVAEETLVPYLRRTPKDRDDEMLELFYLAEKILKNTKRNNDFWTNKENDNPLNDIE